MKQFKLSLWTLGYTNLKMTPKNRNLYLMGQRLLNEIEVRTLEGDGIINNSHAFDQLF
jgi:hypothetical protein